VRLFEARPAAHLTILARRPFVDALLAQYAASRGSGEGPPPRLAEARVALQPSGAAWLEAVEASLGLQDWQAAPARAVLASRGNPSGAGALMALCLALEDAALVRGARGGRGMWGGLRGAEGRAGHLLALALGPGVTAEGLVLEMA